MSDGNAVDPSMVNPSQTSGPGITLPAPVAGTAAPTAPSQDAPPPEGTTTTSQTPPAPSGQQEGNATTTTEHGQPKVDVVPSDTGADGVVTYDETGDAGLDLALGFIGRLGIAGDHPAMVAAANGDFTFLEAHLSTLGDEARGWEKHIQLGKEAFARQLDVFKKEQEANTKAIHSIVGGEANWKALVAWAGKEATPEEKKSLNAMFDAGGFQAQAAARSILAAYQSAKGTTITPANPASQASGATVTPAAPMSAADYHKKAEALYRQLGNRMDQSPEYAELRRQYFRR